MAIGEERQRVVVEVVGGDGHVSVSRAYGRRVPEGDTIHRTAARLRPALSGQVLRRFEAQRMVGARPRVGESIDVVRAHGKHLLIEFSGGLTLETHMMMTGSWHLYRPGERWRKAGHLVRARLDVEHWVAVCFAAPVVRTFATAGPSTPLDHLGPDLVLVDPDLDECVARIDRLGLGERPVAEVLLDQRVGNGIGNVYKSEVCWAERVDPHAPMGGVPAPAQRRLFGTANRLLLVNLGGGPRRTVAGGLAVYGRRSSGCLRCGTPIRSSVSGEQTRVTYWCPTCQQ